MARTEYLPIYKARYDFKGLTMSRFQYGFLLLLLAVSQILMYGLLVSKIPDPSSSAGRDIDPEPLVISIAAELARTQQYKVAENSVDGTRLQALIPEAVKNEFAVIRGQHRTPDTVVSKREHRAKQVTPPDQAAQEAAFAISTGLIDQAISVGRWNERHTQELLPQLARLSENQRIQLLEKFHGAVNRQELALEDVPPL